MPIEAPCPGCGKRLTAPFEYAGRAVKCPACGGRMTVPRPGEAVAAPTPPPFKKAPTPAPPPAASRGKLIAGAIGVAVLGAVVGFGVALIINPPDSVQPVANSDSDEPWRERFEKLSSSQKTVLEQHAQAVVDEQERAAQLQERVDDLELELVRAHGDGVVASLNAGQSRQSSGPIASALKTGLGISLRNVLERWGRDWRTINLTTFGEDGESIHYLAMLENEASTYVAYQVMGPPADLQAFHVMVGLEPGDRVAESIVGLSTALAMLAEVGPWNQEELDAWYQESIGEMDAGREPARLRRDDTMLYIGPMPTTEGVLMLIAMSVVENPEI